MKAKIFRCITLLLCCLIAIGFAACGAPAISSTSGVLYCLSSDNTYAEVCGYEGSAKNVSIASSYNGKPVTHIGEDAFRDCTSMQSVNIPNSVTTIEKYAFYNCSNLFQVTLGKSVTNIENNAFGNCYFLAEVVNRSPYVTIGKNIVFANGDVGRYARIVYNSGDTFQKTHISNVNGCIVCTVPEEVVLVKYIGTATHCTVAKNVTEIHAFAFADSPIVHVTLPDSLTVIGYQAFEYCENLTTVNIPASVTDIYRNAFNGCSALEEVHITDLAAWCNIYFAELPSNPLYTGKLYLNNAPVIDLVIPDTVTQIKKYAFYGCGSLTSATIGNSVTKIGQQAFGYCVKLKKLTIPASVTAIEASAFAGCFALNEIEFLGTIEQWNAIEKSNTWKTNVPATKVVCSNGEVAI